MIRESANIIARIAWCRLQQQLPSVTPEERVGWREEEAGLVDALDWSTTLEQQRHRKKFPSGSNRDTPHENRWR